MQTSVNLKDPFSYSIHPIFIGIFVIIALTIIYVLRKYANRKFDEIPVARDAGLKDIKVIKQKYLKQLDKISHRVINNKISIRVAYQSLSIVIRYFIYEATNIKVQHYTLREIEKLNMPILYELMKEYYVPEFSEFSIGNIKDSIERTREVIEKWN